MWTIILALIVVAGAYTLIFIIEHWQILLVLTAIVAAVLIVIAMLENRNKRGAGAESYSAPAYEDDGVDVFEALAAASILFDDNGTEKHSGRCDGDCANCPPHYGYRYGRYYYGRCHQYGCQFGGNCGDGRYD